MKAITWIHGNKVRILVKDAEGHVRDMDDTYNNRASAEAMIYNEYPEAKVVFITHHDQIKKLNCEWLDCKG